MRLAIFDFDGTLADTWPWFLGIVDDAAVRFGFRRVDAEEARRLRGRGSREIMRALEVPWRKLPAIATYVRRRAAEEVGKLVLFPGAAEMLHEVAGGATIAIVSSNGEETIRQVLGAELAEKVGIFECGAAMFGKPAKLRKALRRSGKEKEAAIAIGDEVRDIEAAREVGIASGGVTWGFATAEVLRSSGATYVFESFVAVREMLVGDRAVVALPSGERRRR